jgi:hypothetical protein
MLEHFLGSVVMIGMAVAAAVLVIHAVNNRKH